MFTYRRITIVLLFSFLFIPFKLLGHESRPVYLEISEIKPGSYSQTLKAPRSLPDFNVPNLKIPAGCKADGEMVSAFTSDSYIKKSIFNCIDSISDKKLQIVYPVLNPSITTIINIGLLNGEKHKKLLKAGELSWTVPEKEDRTRIAKEYTMLGMTHIWDGIDHLLFLLCLVFIATTPRRILITITGFTIAHSITLVLSTLGIVKLPIPPVEAAIALSIVFVASEIARGKKDSLTYKYPVTVSSSFGLLHGFGFASVLSSSGLPQTELPVSLLFFNIGVEIGQVLFILAVMVFLFIFRNTISIHIKNLFKYDKIAAYVIGSAASFWMFQRIYSFWF